jgi:SnoaL-like polyketide cyclase
MTRSISRRAMLKNGTAAAAALAATITARADTPAAGSASKLERNKAIVGRWFTEFWGNPWNPKVIDELAAPIMLLQYSLHAPRRGRDDIRAFMVGFRTAFPDLGFAGTHDLIAEGDYVVGRWKGGGTHTGPACWFVARCYGSQNAVHRYDSHQGGGRQDRRGDRLGRRSDRADTARHPASSVITDTGPCSYI